MAKRRDRFPAGEPEVSLTFRTSPYPLLSDEKNEQLIEEVRAILDTEQCMVNCDMGEVRVTRMTHDYAKMVQLLLEDKKVLNGQYTLQEQ